MKMVLALFVIIGMCTAVFSDESCNTLRAEPLPTPSYPTLDTYEYFSDGDNSLQMLDEAIRQKQEERLILEELIKLQEELIRLEELERKLKTGKAWSA